MLKDLKIYLLTWNVVSRAPIEDLKEALGLNEPLHTKHLPDLYAIGLQEVSCKPQDFIVDIIFEDPWEAAFKEILCKLNYIKLKQIRLQGMMLFLFGRRNLVTHIRGMQTSYTRTGLKGMWGNKGGVSIRLSAFGCSICIVNCHLAAHDDRIAQRIDDYNQILDKQRFIDPQTENIITHDYTFWMGDLNFRIDDYNAEEIEHLIKRRMFAQLLSKDQLRQVMKIGQAFSEFSEAPPPFSPTYKFEIDGNTYDFEKRKPAWTDRILFRLTPNAYDHAILSLRQHDYISHSNYTQSDHKPVSSTFTVKVFKDPKEKRVTFLPMEDWRVNEDSVAWYTFSEGASPNTWDWIALFKSDYTSLDQHVCYVWAPVRPSSSVPYMAVEQVSSHQFQGPWYRVVFADQTLLVPGCYRLFYIGSEFEEVLGISEPFEVMRANREAQKHTTIGDRSMLFL